jgi:hypothetical protein
MKRLSDFKNEEAIDLLADILEPAAEIVTDQNVVAEFRNGNKIRACAQMIKEHKKAVVRILAAMDGKTPENYEFGFFTLPSRVLEVINDEELQAFFISRQIENLDSNFGSAQETTEAAEE